jgi:hypothetical protein
MWHDDKTQTFVLNDELLRDDTVATMQKIRKQQEALRNKKMKPISEVFKKPIKAQIEDVNGAPLFE